MSSLPIRSLDRLPARLGKYRWTGTATELWKILQKKPLTPLEIYKVLPQTNCGRCLVPSCLAFAAAVVQGSKRFIDCPYLAKETAARLSGNLEQRDLREPDQADFLVKLEEKIATLDLAEIAPLIGAVYSDNHLTINSLGKDFQFDHRGEMVSECHIIPWVRAPLLSYITHDTHQNITGNWITFRELKGGIDWQGLFTSRCELPLKKLADDHPALLADIVELFTGRTTAEFQADIALILHPLPHFPLVICYQQPEEDLESTLTILFDECCGVNLHIKSIFTLCSGLVQMFDKIAGLHA